MELQVVILEWLQTAAKLAVHLAQVSQVPRTVQRMPDIVEPENLAVGRV
jgi:hypothetical protein